MRDASPNRVDAAGPRLVWRRLVTWRMTVMVWGPILAIGVIHYATDPQWRWVHDVLRRLYYVPIILGAFRHGLRGGVVAAALVTVTYMPHAFFLPAHHDPAHGLEKSLEFVLYFIVGVVAGYLADLENRRSRQLQVALDEQQRLTKQLVRAGRLSALGEVVAGIAHEVKNPLHVLEATAEIVDPFIPNDAEERRMWDIHVREIGRLAKTAERFLSFARPPKIELQPLDLRDVASRVEELVGVEARQRGVELNANLPDEPVTVRGDRDLLAQVGLNIALNGLKALSVSGAQAGRIRISAESAGHRGARMQTLRIENNGPAIPEEELERIFDPFHGGDEEGTGLGLAISVRIAETHNGYIEAANEGLGVAFTLFLPPV